MLEVLRSGHLSLEPDRAALRGAAGRRRRRAALRRGLVRDRRPAPLHDARRGGPGRRGDHLAVLVRRLGELRDLRGRDARLRRHRRRHAQPRPGSGRGCGHAADEGDRRGRHLRLSLRARRAARDLRPARARPRRGRVRGARRGLQGPAARLARAPRDLGLLPEQADHDRRGRCGHDRLGGRARAARLAAQPGSARDLELAPARPPRLQLPARRHLGGPRDRSARNGSTGSSRRAARSPSATRSCWPESTSSRPCRTTTITSARGSCTS